MLNTGKVKLVSVDVDDKNHVGQDDQWDYTVIVNNTVLRAGQELTIDTKEDKIEISLTVTEDDIVDDIGKANKTYSYNERQGKSIEINIKIEENEGKSFGNKANVSFWFEVK